MYPGAEAIKDLSVAQGQPLAWGARTYIMGIINVTPDSFAGDGLGSDVPAAVERALRLEEDGADFLDIGAESTRPGATPITAEEELDRLLPALEAIALRVQIPISVDTYKATVAQRAVRSGARVINDVWGLKADPDLAKVAAEAGALLIIVHNQRSNTYQNLLPDIFASLLGSVELARKAGVPEDNIVLDPGIGFGKTADHNLEILRRLGEFKALGFPMLVGTSRKSTIQRLLKLTTGTPTSHKSSDSPGNLIQATAATVALSIGGGADIVRVHDVKEMLPVCQTSDALVRGWRPQHWLP